MKQDYSLIEPIGDRVVVRRDKAESLTPGGIALPDVAQHNPRMGTIVAIGPGILRGFSNQGDSERFPMQCKVGDRVLLPHLAEAIALDPDDPKASEVVVCAESQLLAILHKDRVD